jgi:hypothetical protein
MSNEASPSQVTPQQLQVLVKLESIFMPQARKQRDAFYGPQVLATGAREVRSLHFGRGGVAYHQEQAHLDA